jgi:hypothetical protein
VHGTAVIRGTESSIATVSRDALISELRLRSPRVCSLGVSDDPLGADVLGHQAAPTALAVGTASSATTGGARQGATGGASDLLRHRLSQRFRFAALPCSSPKPDLDNDVTFTRERQAHRSRPRGAAAAGACRRTMGARGERNGRWGKARRRSAGETASYAVHGTAVIPGTETSIVTVSRDALVSERRTSSLRCCSLGVSDDPFGADVLGHQAAPTSFAVGTGSSATTVGAWQGATGGASDMLRHRLSQRFRFAALPCSSRKPDLNNETHVHPRTPSVKSSVGEAQQTRASAASVWSPAEAERTVKSGRAAFGGCNVSYTGAEPRGFVDMP